MPTTPSTTSDTGTATFADSETYWAWIQELSTYDPIGTTLAILHNSHQDATRRDNVTKHQVHKRPGMPDLQRFTHFATCNSSLCRHAAVAATGGEGLFEQYLHNQTAMSGKSSHVSPVTYEGYLAALTGMRKSIEGIKRLQGVGGESQALSG